MILEKSAGHYTILETSVFEFHF